MIARNDDVDRRLHVLEDEHGAGDIEAMVRHLPEHSTLYANMGMTAVKLARQKGTLNAAQAKDITELLKQIEKLLKGVEHEHTQ